jgi:hypothetical protein
MENSKRFSIIAFAIGAWLLISSSKILIFYQVKVEMGASTPMVSEIASYVQLLIWGFLEKFSRMMRFTSFSWQISLNTMIMTYLLIPA